jgi:predicted deacylase
MPSAGPGREVVIEESNAVRRQRIVLPSMSPGTERSLVVLRFGAEGARPKAYLQASLHADELPAMLVLNHLSERLRQAAADGAMRGQVVLVPAANPVGLAQFVQGRAMGRFALAGAGNFNRQFPDLTEALDADVAPRLGDDAARNVSVVRAAMKNALDGVEAADEVARLRHTLLGLACDADIALDLHCDSEAVLHVFLGTPLWPDAADLPAQLGSRATLLATDSGGHPFDEAVGGPWWALAERYPHHPIPPACLSATVEFRGRGDVSEAMAAADADNLFRFLQRRGVIGGDPGPLPAALCEATPLEGVDMIRAPVAGVIAYHKEPGERVAAGDVVAVVVDPLADDFAGARVELRSRCEGVLYGRSEDRLARPGKTVCKIAGRDPLPDRHAGALLSD